MSDQRKFCPGCLQFVELEYMLQGHYKCKNCWRIYDHLEDLPDTPMRRAIDRNKMPKIAGGK